MLQVHTAQKESIGKCCMIYRNTLKWLLSKSLSWVAIKNNNIGFHMRRNSQSIIFQLSKSKFPVLYYVKSNRRKNIFCHQIDELYVTKIGVFIIKHWLVTASTSNRWASGHLNAKSRYESTHTFLIVEGSHLLFFDIPAPHSPPCPAQPTHPPFTNFPSFFINILQNFHLPAGFVTDFTPFTPWPRLCPPLWLLVRWE